MAINMFDDKDDRQVVIPIPLPEWFSDRWIPDLMSRCNGLAAITTIHRGIVECVFHNLRLDEDYERMVENGRKVTLVIKALDALSEACIAFNIALMQEEPDLKYAGTVDTSRDNLREASDWLYEIISTLEG